MCFLHSMDELLAGVEDNAMRACLLDGVALS